MRHIEIKYVKERKRRKEMYRKRSISLKKSAFELSKLCDIPVLMICYGEEGDVITWPENKHEIEEIAERSRRCTYKIRHRNRNSCCDTEKMRKQTEKTKAKLREMTADSVSEIRHSMYSKLIEIRGRIEALSQQNNKDSDDNIVQEESMPVDAETIATSENSEGSKNVHSFDLNQLALDDNSQDGVKEDINLVVKEESEPALENSEDARTNTENEEEKLNREHDRTNSNEESVRINLENEQDEHENARMMNDYMTMRCHWYWMAINYWSAQLSLNLNSGADNFVHERNPVEFVPGSVNIMTPLLPTDFVQPENQNGLPLGSGNVANESDEVQR